MQLFVLSSFFLLLIISCCHASKCKSALAIDLYYDAGFLDPDTVFIQSMCKARECFTTVTFTFHVGVCLEKDDGNLKCSNADESSTDCTNAFKDVCASQLVPNFDDYLCCLYYSDESMTPEQCVQNQNVDMDEFNNCVNLQDPNISPVDILVQNSKAALAKFNDPNALPFLSFNGQNDVCARDAFYDDPEGVICAMLAQGVEESCNVGDSNQ